MTRIATQRGLRQDGLDWESVVFELIARAASSRATTSHERPQCGSDHLIVRASTADEVSDGGKHHERQSRRRR